MTRADLLTYLQNTLPALATETGIALTDTAAGIAYPLDQALTALGSDTDNTAAGYALGEYYTLRKMRFAVASRVDFDATAVKSKRSQIFEQIDALIKDAAESAAEAGHAPGASTTGSITTINLDYIEPDLETV